MVTTWSVLHPGLQDIHLPSRPISAVPLSSPTIPSSAPFPPYLYQAQECVLSSGGNRLIQIAEEVYANRVKTGAPGDANSDWVVSYSGGGLLMICVLGWN